MNSLTKRQKRAAIILILAILVVFLILLAFIDISAFFLALVALVLGICALRSKNPALFAVFSREPKAKDEKAGNLGGAAPSIHQADYRAHMILLYRGGVTTQQIAVDHPEFTIGRSSSCNFVLEGNKNISRSHAIIRYEENKDRSVLIDNHSAHGTKLNGEWIPPGTPRPLHTGDIIQIEDRMLEVQNKNY